MKVEFRIISNIVWSHLSNLLNDELASNQSELHSVDEAAFLIQIKRALTQKKKRIVIDVDYND
ncbi:hypothetical protein LCGC14_1239630 [marine sediment metagenome]|uniref:Uncharacterized protein n=1 Tax=marine sediment metagenome TaxID=412755 RepID=A0A0F9L6G3_9ZZZZ